MVKGNGNGWFRRKKSKLMFCFYNDTGQERAKTLGPASLTDNQGRVLVGKHKYDELVGKPDPLPKIKSTNSVLKFGTLLDHWLDYGKTRIGRDKDHGTKITEKHNADKYLSPKWGDKPAAEIRSWEIQEWLDGQSEGIRSKLKNTMSSIFRHGRKRELLPADFNPTKDVSVPEGTDYEAIQISGADAAAIIRTLHDPLLKVLTVLVGMTGMRISEALALSWAHVLWHHGVIRIERKWTYDRFGKPKSRASKKPVSLSATLAAWLRSWRRESMYASDSDLIFPSHKLKGKSPRTKSEAAKALREAAVRAGVLERKTIGEVEHDYHRGELVKRFGFHSLRHGLATWLAEQGKDPVLIQRMLRHSSMKMTAHYIHTDASKAQEEYAAVAFPAP